LIALLQQVIDTSGQGRMAEQITLLIKELNVASASMVELTQTLRDTETQENQLRRIEAKLDTLLANLIDPG
jgi:type III secretion system FlhB-like substrate exporter